MGRKPQTHLRKAAPILRNEDPSLDRDLRARRLDDEVHARGAALRKPELLHHELRVALRVRAARLALLELGRGVRVRRGVLLRELEPRGHDVDGDDAGCAQRARDGHAEQADGPRAEDDDGLVCAQLGGVCDGVDRDGEGLHLCTWWGQ